MEDKVTYIDCLLNIAMCQENERKEFESLEKTRAELEKLYSTFDELSESFSV